MPCNNNCNQGRACDCVPDLPIQFANVEEEEVDNMKDALYLIGAVALVIFIAGMAFGFLLG